VQYSWPKVVDHIRSFTQNRVHFLGATPQETLGFAAYFKEMLHQTDTFHPWNSDGELSRALDKMPKSCNYRSIKSYWANKEGRWTVEDACAEILTEMEDTIQDWFNNSWNHPPGYAKPLEITFDDDNWSCEKLARQLIALCRKA
jgi:hypothetical protein